MPMEIALTGTRWATTKVAPTRNAPFAGLGAVVPGAATSQGVQVRVRMSLSGRKAPNLAELYLLFMPAFTDNGYKLEGASKLVVDDNPVWIWRRGDPAKYNGEKNAWEAVIGSGPFAGTEGGSILYSEAGGPPTLKDTADLPTIVLEWTALFRPASDAGLSDTALGKLRETLKSDGLKPLQQAYGATGARVTVARAPLPDKPSAKVVPMLASAAILGVALTLLTRSVGRRHA